MKICVCPQNKNNVCMICHMTEDKCVCENKKIAIGQIVKKSCAFANKSKDDICQDCCNDKSGCVCRVLNMV